MPPARWLDRRFSLLGGSLTAAGGLVIGVTLVTSILGAQVPGILAKGAFAPALVFGGQLWRMVTWVFFEQNPLGLIFAALAIYWLGNDLVRIWAPVRFLATYVGLAAAAYLAIGVRYAARLQPSGDEPHYLLMAQSLWREGDLDLRDNMARGDFLEYTPGPLQPHYGAPRPDGRPFPAHGVLLPLLLAPVYALGGRTACVALMALAAAALAFETFRLCERVTGDRRAALWGHAVRNALIPVVTVMGLQFSNLLAGTVVIENVFQLPGLGRLVFQAIANRDVPVVRDAVVILAAKVVLINFVVDLLYAWIDPRLKAHDV